VVAREVELGDFDTTIFRAIFEVEVYGRAEAMRMHNVYQVMNAQSILRAWRSKMHALSNDCTDETNGVMYITSVPCR
jgi:hypothetical protein